MESAEPGRCGLRIIAKPELKSENGAERDEAVEDGVIAHSPGNAAEKSDGERKRGQDEPGVAFFVSAPGEPDEQKREDGKKSGVGHQRETPQQAVADPVNGAFGFGELQSGPENYRGEQRGETRLPHAFVREQNAVGKNCPEPRCTGTEAYSSDAPAGIKNGNAGEADEKNVERSGCKKRIKRVDSEKMKH